jgi:hypothetical protein
MKTIPFTSLSNLIGLIEDQFSSQATVYFRGQGGDHPLLPSIARLKPKRRGMSLLQAEEKLLRAFQRRSLPFLEMRPETQWDWLAVAQHYGLPTRLLDWSVDALAALWFAVEKPPKQRDGVGVVWIFEAREGLLEEGGDFVSSTTVRNPFAVERPSIFVPRYVSKRIVGQGGYFTILPGRSTVEPTFLPLDQHDGFKDRLLKVVIPASSFPIIRHDLTRLGTNAMTIYPDLGGLCQDIKWRYALAPDETAELWDEHGRLRR